MIKKTLLFIFLFLCTERLCHKATDGFSLDAIFKTETISFTSHQPKPEILQILKQKFSYLGKGAQFYAFMSEDGHHIIKFFKKRRLTRSKHTQERYFNSCLLAEHCLKEETGLEYLHLQAESIGTIYIEDKLGILHTIDTKDTPFILQKKADPFYSTLAKFSNDAAFIAKTTESLKTLIAKRCKANIRDKDPDLATNFGFVNGRLIQFDVGRFYIAPFSEEEEITKVLYPLQKWLDAHL